MSALKWGSFEYFYLIILLVILMILYFSFEKIMKNKLQKAFGAKISPWLSQSVSYSRARFKFCIQMVALLFMIVALARPQLGQNQQEVKSEGVELMILADVSESMLAEDVRPSRLERMKIELEKLMDLMPGNKTGLIAFAGSSALMSPLTSDPSALKMYIQSLDVNSVSTQGTNFETALTYAKEAFEKGGITQSDTVKATRVILVASDGEDQEPNALEAIKKLSENGIHVITVAYGTEKGSTIPARDYRGNLSGVRKDSSGNPIITQVKGDFLKQMASETNGQFFVTQYNGDHLKQIEKAIGQYEQAQFSSAVTLQYNEVYIYPLMIGFVLYLLSFFVAVRSRQIKPIEVTYE